MKEITNYYKISIDEDIVDVYSVFYSKNRKEINNARWSKWDFENISMNYYTFEP